MKIEDLDWSKRTDIDARDIASALIDLGNARSTLLKKAYALDVEAAATRKEVEGTEICIDILRKKLEMSLHKVGENE